MDRSRRGFTLIELLVVIAIIAILAAILFPVFARARENARKSTCQSNLKQIGTGIMMYSQDFDETLPCGAGGGTVNGGTNRWYNAIYPYTKNTGVLVCPSKPGRRGYGLSTNLCAWGSGSALAQIPAPADTALVMEAGQCTSASVTGNNDPLSWLQYETGATDWQVILPTGLTGGASLYNSDDTYGNYSRRPLARHMDTICVAYCDGHVKSMNIKQFLGPLPGGWPYGDTRNAWDNK